MVKFEFRNNKFFPKYQYKGNISFEEVELFLLDLWNGKSESWIMHQLDVWSNGIYPNIKDEFTLENIENVIIHRKVLDETYNYVKVVFVDSSIRFILSDRQINILF